MKTLVIVYFILLLLVILCASGCASKPCWKGSGANARRVSLLQQGPITQRHWYGGSIQDRNLLRAAVYATIDSRGGK